MKFFELFSPLALALLLGLILTLLLRLILVRLSRIFKVFDSRLVQVGKVGEVDGITICDPCAPDLEKSSFFKHTGEALSLIRKFDPKRHRRVCRYLRYIVNRPLISGGNFERVGKICSVDYDKHYAAGPRQWRERAYACLIIHEATHGMLDAKGIAYSKKNWEQTERLCKLEEYRFIRRVDEWWADEHLSPKRFNPAYWRRYRESKSWRQKAWRERFEEWRQERLKRKREKEREKRYELLRKKGRRLF